MRKGKCAYCFSSLYNLVRGVLLFMRYLTFSVDHQAVCLTT
ncbi:hypothetical protein HDE78_003000 [Rhodanobacter sp. K2T2]|nr:hypothetical protein [Rhodanobacter sp. K2T2]